MLSRSCVAAACTLACSLAQAQPVVRVELFKGAPTVVKDGRTIPAAYGQELSRKDQIRVPASSWLVLQILKNDFAVKIDEDLELPVSDIALLDAPRHAKSFDDQLAAMAKAKEIELNDRVTGYQNRRMAGSGGGGSKGGGRSEPQAEQAAPKEEAEAAAPAVQPAPPPPASAPAPAVFEKPKLKKKASRGAAADKETVAFDDEVEAKRDSGPGSGAPTYRWATVVGGVASERGGEPLAAAIVEAIRKARVEQCIREAFKAVRLDLPKADHLLLRKVDGKVQVKLGSRLELADACARAFDGVAGALPDKGWVRVEIRLAQ